MSLDAGALAALAAELARLGPDRCSTNPAAKEGYGRDMLPRELLARAAGRAESHRPDMVAWPRSTEEVAAMVRAAAAHRVPVVPFGAGSGVCGGAVPIRGGLTIDLSHMNRVLAIDDRTQTAVVEAGVVGQTLEAMLEARGLMLGHYPSSIMCSTVGGWIATRGAGQMSTRYGKIEDLIVRSTWIDGRGERIDVESGSSPDWSQLLIGSEGTLAIVTQATLSVRRAPETRVLRGWQFEDFASGCEAVRALMQADLKPAVVRLYDEFDTLIHRQGGQGHEHAPIERSARQWIDQLSPRPPGARPPRRLADRLLAEGLARPRWSTRALDRAVRISGGGCLLVLGFEGLRELAEAEAALARPLLERARGQDLGEGPGQRWLRERYAVSSLMPKILEAGGMVDTMEVAAPWSHIDAVYRAVRRALDELAVVLAHVSHVYSDGAAIYFSFVGPAGELAQAQARYDELWARAADAVQGAGGALSHHHGIGTLKAPFLAREIVGGGKIARVLSKALDPDGTMNPGKVWS
jgi:alkyldihydroxyacetonephosphate synthase